MGTKVPVTNGPPPQPAEPPLSTFSARLMDAGAPHLPEHLMYVVTYHPTFNDGTLIHLDIYSKDLKRLLASVERIVSRKNLKVQDFVSLAFEAAGKLPYEDKLPPAVKRLLIGG